MLPELYLHTEIMQHAKFKLKQTPSKIVSFIKFILYSMLTQYFKRINTSTKAILTIFSRDWINTSVNNIEIGRIFQRADTFSLFWTVK